MKMNTSKILTLSALLAGSALNAASITWTAGTFDNAGPASVLNADNLVYAGNANGSALTVDVSGTDVTFDALTISGVPTGNAYIANVTGLIVDTDTFWTGGDANWDSIMNTQALRVTAGGDAMELVLQNLSDGQEYQIQLFASDDNNSGNRTTVFSDAATGGNIASELRLGDKDYVVGTFIADGASQSVFAQVGSFASNTAYITGFSLTTIPEPGTYALIGGLLALGSVMLRRRR